MANWCIRKDYDIYHIFFFRSEILAKDSCIYMNFSKRSDFISFQKRGGENDENNQ
jgi:hypothetical protein